MFGIKIFSKSHRLLHTGRVRRGSERGKALVHYSLYYLKLNTILLKHLAKQVSEHPTHDAKPTDFFFFPLSKFNTITF